MKKKILVVEDEVHIQRLIKLILEKHDFEVSLASSGEEGLEVLAKNPLPDLVLMDIMLGGVDGLQALRAIKANARTKDLSVVLLTALAQEDVVIKGVQLGAKDYIRKPFHPQEFVARVTKLVA